MADEWAAQGGLSHHPLEHLLNWTPQCGERSQWRLVWRRWLQLGSPFQDRGPAGSHHGAFCCALGYHCHLLCAQLSLPTEKSRRGERMVTEKPAMRSTRVVSMIRKKRDVAAGGQTRNKMRQATNTIIDSA